MFNDYQGRRTAVQIYRSDFFKKYHSHRSLKHAQISVATTLNNSLCKLKKASSVIGKKSEFKKMLMKYQAVLCQEGITYNLIII
jgi:hypothetical protein